MIDYFRHSSKQQRSYIFLILFLVLGVQLVRINRPFLGHYASYQGTVMASIARNMLRENFSEILLPKTDAIIGGKRSLHLNQYPFPSLVAALGVKLFGGTFEFWGRFQGVLFNLLSAFCLMLITRKLFQRRLGLISAAIFLLSPYTLTYGQAFMSESMSLFFLLLSFYLLLQTPARGRTLFYLVSSGLSFSLAVTGRIHFIIFLPVCLFQVLNISGAHRRKILNLVIFLFFCAVISVAWYAHTYFVSLHASNVHTNIFLQLTEPGSKSRSLLINPDYYRRIFDQVSQLWLTPLLFPFFFLGLILLRKEKKEFQLITRFIVFGFSIVLLAPEKVMDHDFYLYGVFPFVVITTAYGLAVVLGIFPFAKTWRMGMFAVLFYFGVSSRFFYHPIFKYPESQNNVVRAAQMIQAQTASDDRLIIAGNDLGAASYYLDRAAWPLQCDLVGKKLSFYRKNARFAGTNLGEVLELEEAMKSSVAWLEHLKKQGADYLVALDKKEVDQCQNLIPYLKQHDQDLSTDKDDFYLFKINHKT